MIQQPNANNAFNRRGSMPSGHPKGWGQQRGHSPWLDQAAPDPNEDLDLQNLQPRMLASDPGLAQPQQVEPPDEEGSIVAAALRGQRQMPSMGMAPDMFQTAGAPTSGTIPIIAAPHVIPQPAMTGTDWHVAPIASAAPNGWDQGNWDNPDMQSVKYRHQRLANGINRPSDMGALVQSEAYQRAFPGATFDGRDHVNFNGALADGDHGEAVGNIDVLIGADHEGDTAQGPTWLPDGERDQITNPDPQKMRRAAIAQQFLGQGGGDLADNDLEDLLNTLLEQELL